MFHAAGHELCNSRILLACLGNLSRDWSFWAMGWHFSPVSEQERLCRESAQNSCLRVEAGPRSFSQVDHCSWLCGASGLGNEFIDVWEYKMESIAKAGCGLAYCHIVKDGTGSWRKFSGVNLCSAKNSQLTEVAVKQSGICLASVYLLACLFLELSNYIENTGTRTIELAALSATGRRKTLVWKEHGCTLRKKIVQ